MDLSKILSGLGSGISGLFEDDPKKKKASKPYDFDAEMKGAIGKTLKYDNNRSAKDVVLSAAKRGGIDPAFLLSSSYQEGLGKAILAPDEVSEAYTQAKGLNTGAFPVDGFYNYGTDTFGNRYDKLKKYLPEGFEKEFQLYDAVNEKGEKIKTAAFKNNESGLVAKAAMMRAQMDEVDEYAKSKGIQLDDKARKYFTLAAYNAGEGNSHIMMDEYARAADKNSFIDKGLTSRGGVHKNVSPRMNRMKLAQELLIPEEKTIPAASSPASLVTQ